MASLLLNLPVELRLQIWDLLLSPPLSTKSSHDSGYTLTSLLAPCDKPCYFLKQGLDIHKCKTSWRLMSPRKQQLTPQILRVSRCVYEEALPTLYHGRIFEPIGLDWYPNDDCYARGHWSVMNRWVRQLSPKVLRSIHAVALPLAMITSDMPYMCASFFSISAQLTELQLVEVHVQSGPLPGWCEDLHVHGYGHKSALTGKDMLPVEETYWLRPLMGFTKPRIHIIVQVTDIVKKEFDLLKSAIERDISGEASPLRSTSVSLTMNFTKREY